MPIQMPDFGRISFDEANPLLKGMRGGQDMFSTILQQRLSNLQAQTAQAQLPFVGPQAQADLKKALLSNDYQKIVNQYEPNKLQLANQNQKNINDWYAPDIKSQIANRIANANETNTMLPLKAQNQKNINDWYGKNQQAEINYKNMGGAGMGTGGKEELTFQNFVARDNPQLKNAQQVYEASNVLRQGGHQLSDGTPLNQISPAAEESLNRLTKYGSTNTLITQGVNANQADSEINVLSKFAQEGLKPYGNTYFNKSPEQIMDSFRSNETSQKRLGKFIAAQQLQYEISQNQIKIAMGQPGVTSTQELMGLGQQVLDTKYPKLSYTARHEANRYFLEALRKGLESRKQVGIGARSSGKNINTESNQSKNSNDFSQLSDEELNRIAYGK